MINMLLLVGMTKIKIKKLLLVEMTTIRLKYHCL